MVISVYITSKNFQNKYKSHHLCVVMLSNEFHLKQWKLVHEGHNFIHFPVCYKCPQWMLTHRSPAGFVLIQSSMSDFCIVEYINYCIYSKVWVYHLKKSKEKSHTLEVTKCSYTTLHHTREPVMFSHERNELWIGSNLPETINQSEVYAISSSLLIGWSPQAVSVSTKYPDAKQNCQRGEQSVPPQCWILCLCVCILCMDGWVKFDLPQRY